MPLPLIIPIVLGLAAALGVSGCATTGRPEDDDDVTPTPPDDDDTAPIDDDDSSVSSTVDEDGDNYYTCDLSEQQQYENLLCGDCNDGDATVYPTADESTQNGVENDCDDLIDEDYVEPSVCKGKTGLQLDRKSVV